MNRICIIFKIYFHIICLFILVSCGSIKYVPTETKTIYNYVDSTVVSYKDSIIFVEIPKERIIDVVAQYDTSKLETSVAKSTAYVDTTTHTLKHSLTNKENSIQTKVKVEYVDRIVYRDSVVTKEVPVEVPVEVVKYPKTYWILLTWAIICILFFILKIYKKFAF